MPPNTRTLKGQSYSTKRWANLAWPKGSKLSGFSINQSNGVIYISRFLAKEMELKDGDKIIFANDEESKKDWFISKTNDEYGFVLHSSKAGVRVQSKFICNSVLNATKTNCNATFLVAKEATEYNGNKFFKIIISSPFITIPRNHPTNKKLK